MKLKFDRNYPCAEYRNGIITDTLSASDPVTSMEAARNVIATWAEDYHLLHAWIKSECTDIDTGRIVTRMIRLF